VEKDKNEDFRDETNIPKMLKFYLSIEKFKNNIVLDIFNIYVNLQKDILKELLLKLSVRDMSKITRCKGYYIDYKNKRIYFVHKLYDFSLYDLENNESIDLPYEKRLNIIKELLKNLDCLHTDRIFNLNLTLNNIKITKKNKIKFASLKNGIKIDSENKFIKQIYSKFHFGSIFNSKINFPPEFYDLKNKTINNINLDCEENLIRIFSAIDIWSFGVIMSLIFSDKDILRKNLLEINFNKNELHSAYERIDYISCNLIDAFYKQKKIFPEALFKNINTINNYIRGIVIGILRYNPEERPSLRDMIYLFKNL